MARLYDEKKAYSFVLWEYASDENDQSSNYALGVYEMKDRHEELIFFAMRNNMLDLADWLANSHKIRIDYGDKIETLSSADITFEEKSCVCRKPVGLKELLEFEMGYRKIIAKKNWG